jgi:hypothetical protein
LHESHVRGDGIALLAEGRYEARGVGWALPPAQPTRRPAREMVARSKGKIWGRKVRGG